MGATLAAAIGLLAGFSASPASAAQANQEWFGSNAHWYSNNYAWYPLGDPIAAVTDAMQIHSLNGGRCLDVPGNNFFSFPMTNGYPLNDTQVQLYDCKGVTDSTIENQEWYQQDNGDGSWTYHADTFYSWAPNRPYCLDSLMNHQYDGSPVAVWACNLSDPDPAQRWTIGPESQLQSVEAPGFCADGTNWGSGDGTPIQLWQCAY